MDESTKALLERLTGLLEKRLRIIADHEWRDRDQPGHLAALKDVSADIDSVKRQVPRGLDADLTHYLERSSFDKALAQMKRYLG